ncbi:MAG: acetyl-CoA hydrolase [Clostridia bacterium]|nr:acetyl-CoA hydrolase [Clostridia bacterium]
MAQLSIPQLYKRSAQEMRIDFEKEYNNKLMSPQEAVRLVKSGDTVYEGTCTSVAYGLCDALSERGDELENVTLTCSQIIYPVKMLEGTHPGAFKLSTYFMGTQERNCLKKNLLEVNYSSVHLSQVDLWCRETQRPDVVFFEVSPPDENGYMSYGASGVALHTYLKESAKIIILQVNSFAPYVYGEQNLIHFSEATAIVETNRELPEIPNMPIDDSIKTISSFLLDQIPDGACIQLGIGGVANAVGYGLKTKNDLGIHTEMMADSMMELMKMGVVNNSRKNFIPGKSVSAFTFGSKELYKFINRNENMYYLPFTVVNNPSNIAKNDNMISINTAISVDILGQVNADNIGGRQHSATGGQVDFVRGAQMSKGGKSFIAIQSTIENEKLGRQSRIVSHFPIGTAVTTPRSDVQYVATEFGCVNLKLLTMKERVKAMIGLAHPDFRPQLTEDAKTAGLL